jgi:hypothetical protein
MRKEIEAVTHALPEKQREGTSERGRPLQDLESVVDRMRQLDAVDARAYADQRAKAAGS